MDKEKITSYIASVVSGIIILPTEIRSIFLNTFIQEG